MNNGNSTCSCIPACACHSKVEVPTSRLDTRHTNTIRVHHASGTGQVDVADLVSTQSYSVLTRGYGDHATVAVRVV